MLSCSRIIAISYFETAQMKGETNISTDEKIAIMYLLNAISQADGKIEQEELDYLTYFTQEHHLNLDEETFKQQKLDQLCAAIITPQAKQFAIEQIIELSICDNNYHDTERRAAMLLANSLAISTEDFLTIEKHIIQHNHT